MLVWIALMLSSATAPPDRLDFQMMTSPAYMAFASQGDRVCPARKLRYLHPADLDFIEEDFLASLPAPDRRRVERANVGFRGCPEMGTSCPAQHLLTAIMRTHLLSNFVQSACSSPT